MSPNDQLAVVCEREGDMRGLLLCSASLTPYRKGVRVCVCSRNTIDSGRSGRGLIRANL